MDVPQVIIDAFKSDKIIREGDFYTYYTHERICLRFKHNDLIFHLNNMIVIRVIKDVNLSFIDEFPEALLSLSCADADIVNILQFDNSRRVIEIYVPLLISLISIMQKKNLELICSGILVYGNLFKTLDISLLNCKFIISNYEFQIEGINENIQIFKNSNLKYKYLKDMLPGLLDTDHPFWEFNRYELSKEFLRMNKTKSAKI